MRFDGSIFRKDGELWCELVNQRNGAVHYVTPPPRDRLGKRLRAKDKCLVVLTDGKKKLHFTKKKQIRVTLAEVKKIFEEMKEVLGES